MATLRELGEREIIRRLARLIGGMPDGVVGIGDDTAVVHAGDGRDYLLTSDAIVEGTHFVPDVEPARIGHKAIGRVLSDLAAMGGTPLWALIDLVASADTEYDRVESVYRGAQALAGRHGFQIVGGDTARGPVLELHVFGVGWLPAGSAILRSGARPGDRVFVTGELGGSLKGKHLDFEPRVPEGRWLREAGGVTAMMDVSDGLITDLRHLVEESGVGVEWTAEAVPVSAAARSVGSEEALKCALYDGEDFELLFCVASDRAESLAKEWRSRFRLACTEIGAITNEKDRIVMRQGGQRLILEADGYEHFRRA